MISKFIFLVIFFSIAGEAMSGAIKLGPRGSCSEIFRSFYHSSQKVEIDFNRQIIEEYKNTLFDSWNKYFVLLDKDKLLKNISKRKSGNKERHQVARIKTSGTYLRNFFMAFDESHEIPENLQFLVKTAGQIRDSLKFGKEERASKKAKKLKKLLEEYNPKIDLDSLSIVEIDSSKQFLKMKLKSIRVVLQKDIITAYEFHHMKKDYRILCSVLEGISGSRNIKKKTLNSFLSIQDELGEMNEVLVKKKAHEGIKYKDTDVKLSKYFKGKFKKVVELLTVAD